MHPAKSRFALLVTASVAAALLAGCGWTIQPTVNTSKDNNFLNGVSCPSAGECTAVGGAFTDGADGVLLAEHWDGRAWDIQPTPGATALQGVSCTSSSACTAVGDTVSFRGPVTLAERWNGTAWEVQPTPGANSSLEGVSCPSPSVCIAVGGSYDPSSNTTATLAERWNGSTWEILPTPDLAGYAFSGLGDVSCTAPDSCVAVGSSDNGPGEAGVTRVERWDGKAWTVQPSPNPSGATTSYLRGVSCAAQDACTAVGSYVTGSGAGHALAERWDGSAWAIQSTPTVTGSALADVSCPTRSVCAAVGSRPTSSGGLPLAERWSDGSWQVQPTASPSGAQASLSGVSCPTEQVCAAVGWSYANGKQATLAERFSADP